MIEVSMIAKKGDKFLCEIEIIKDCDLMDTCIIRSIYAKGERREIEGTFIINQLNFYKSLQDYKEKVMDKIKEAVDSNTLGI